MSESSRTEASSELNSSAEVAQPASLSAEQQPIEPSPSAVLAAEAGQANVALTRSRAALGGRALGEKLLGLLAVLIAVLSLLYPIAHSGIWDPPELQVADQARRIALNLMGAEQLALEGANNAVPTSGELERGELPFTSIAAGFKLFGLNEWAGRLPLALWALLGALAVYGLVRRLADSVAASLGVIVLCTMPLYFLHARTMLGEVVTFSGLAIACAGLGLCVFDRRSLTQAKGDTARGVFYLFLGLLGLGVGFGSRGLLIGVAVPCLGVGLAWAFSVSARRSSSFFAGGVGLGCLLLGIIAAWIGAKELLSVDPAYYSRWVGAGVQTLRQRPTYDAVIHQLGHALLPWSALVPIAIGMMFRSPAGLHSQGASERGGHEREAATGADDFLAAERELGLRLLLILTASLAFAAHSLMAPVTGLLAYSAVFALAAMVGLALRDAQLRSPGSLAVGIVVVALSFIFYTDYKNFPEKGFSAFVVSVDKFPDSFKETATAYIKYGCLLAAGLFALLFMERGGARDVFRRKEYERYFHHLRQAFNGNLMFFLLLAWAALVGFGLLNAASQRYYHWEKFEGLSAPLRAVAAYGWLLVPALMLAPALGLAARDGLRWLFARLPSGRFVAAGLALASFGLVLSLGYYPALAAQISPKEVFEAYERLAKEGEPLAILGKSSDSAAYYTGSKVVNHPNVNAGTRWLDSPEQRRWMVVGATDIAQANSRYRERHKKNLPVLDARSSEILLVSNRLLETEQNQNPFLNWVLDEPREPAVKVGANLDQLTNLGWEILNQSGEPVQTELVRGKPAPVVSTGVRYQFAIHWKVNRNISGNWKTFIHIDGHRRRYNGDHDTLEGKYPPHLWRRGDQIVDLYEIRLEPHFSSGEYEVLYGLYIGDRRLSVVEGAHDKDRIRAGHLLVR